MSENKRSITRRDFLKDAAAGTAGLTFGADKLWSVAGYNKQGGSRSKVVVGKCEKIIDERNNVNQKAVDTVLEAVMKKYTGKKSAKTAWKELFSPKDIVGIKMNVMMAATHNEVVLSIIKNLISIGIPEENIIVFERGRGGAGKDGIESRKGFGYNEDKVSRIITDKATALINVPGLKSHWLSGIAGCIKNWCGAVTDINVQDKNAAFVVHKNSCEDLGLIPAYPAIKNKLRLNIADAIRPLAHGGPQVDPKYLWQQKEIIVSEDQVAVDAACLKILQDKRKEMKGEDWPLYPPPIHLAASQNKYKLGIADLNRIDIERVEV